MAEDEVLAALGKMDAAITGLTKTIEHDEQERFTALERRVHAIELDVLQRFEAREREVKADRRMIFTALVAPFIMLVVALTLTAVLVG
jgi:hypothetical protein